MNKACDRDSLGNARDRIYVICHAHAHALIGASLSEPHIHRTRRVERSQSIYYHY